LGALTILGYIVLAGAVLTALGIIWKKGILPLALFISHVNEMVPLLKALNETFKDNPTGFKVLNEIAAQFRTDSGSSLRDVVNRLEVAAKDNKEAAERAAVAADNLRIGVEAQRLLDVKDREVMQELTLKLDRVKTRVMEGSATSSRIEENASHVAEDLAESRKREGDKSK
jgi:methyl-accepting chemotaxis protein